MSRSCYTWCCSARRGGTVVPHPLPKTFADKVADWQILALSGAPVPVELAGSASVSASADNCINCTLGHFEDDGNPESATLPMQMGVEPCSIRESGRAEDQSD